MTKKVSFTFPISSDRVWKGQLNVTAKVDGQEVEIESVIHQDPRGRKSNVTELVDEWCINLSASIWEAAINNADNDEDLVTLEKQDWV